MSPYAMAPSVLCRAAWRAGGRRSIAAAAASRSDRGRKGVPGGVGDGRPLTLTSLMSSKGCGMRPPLAGAGTAVDGRGDGFGVNGVSASSVRWVVVVFVLGVDGTGGVVVCVMVMYMFYFRYFFVCMIFLLWLHFC